MFSLAIAIGIYSYLIFFFGLLGLLTKENVTIVTVGWLAILLFIEKKYIILSFRKIKSVKFSLKSIFKNKLLSLLAVLIVLQALVNLIGAIGPELAFDALWYHLTLPKLYLLQHSIYHIPGGLLYYSDMPKLGEMLYTGALGIGNEITAKIIHFLFGILISIAIYKIARRIFSPLICLLAVVIFYSNLVVDWESTTAYIDLIRTFFETMSIWGLLNWFETKKVKWLIISALMIGFAVTTKLLAFGTVLILSILILIHYIDSRLRGNDKESVFHLFIRLFVYWLIVLLIPLPWFIFSFIHTGNPVFPFFTHNYEVTPEVFSVFGFFKEVWTLFTHASDPVSPIYLLFLPLLFFTFVKFKKEVKYLVVFSGIAIVVWYFTPRTGGGRFILPYLPAFSIIIAAIVEQITENKKRFGELLPKLLFTVIVFVSLISLLYRGAANAKYVPVIFGMESKQTFLRNHLNFSFGDFYDTDNYFAKHITQNDRVLTFGFHNLYYIDFPFVDNSWVQRWNKFDYVAVQNSRLPARFKNWQLIYKNDKTLVQLYQPPKGVCPKICAY
ncbi:MAG: ArnT family glycosyltransferase [Candidatus Levyibacteriota bacterium]